VEFVTEGIFRDVVSLHIGAHRFDASYKFPVIVARIAEDRGHRAGLGHTEVGDEIFALHARGARGDEREAGGGFEAEIELDPLVALERARAPQIHACLAFDGVGGFSDTALRRWPP